MIFNKMEWWRNPNTSGLGHAYVGFCDNGEIHLTFDVRGGIPVFSHYCQVGAKNAHKMEAYQKYRELFSTLDGYRIVEIKECLYKLLNQDKSIKWKQDG